MIDGIHDLLLHLQELLIFCENLNLMLDLLHTFLGKRKLVIPSMRDCLYVELSIPTYRFSFVQFVVLKVDLPCVDLILAIAQVLRLFVDCA